MLQQHGSGATNVHPVADCIVTKDIDMDRFPLGRMLLATAASIVALALPSRALPAAVDQWPTYNNGYDGQRYSSVARITPANVGTLKRVCEAQLGDAGAFHAGPIVIDNTLYVTTAHTTVALDATSCAIRWRHVYKPEQPEVYSVNRGAAWLDGRLFRGTGDGRMLAVDALAATTRQQWEPKLRKVLTGKQTARFLQLDRRISLLIEIQVASIIPLVK